MKWLLFLNNDLDNLASTKKIQNLLNFERDTVERLNALEKKKLSYLEGRRRYREDHKYTCKGMMNIVYELGKMNK